MLYIRSCFFDGDLLEPRSLLTQTRAYPTPILTGSVFPPVGLWRLWEATGAISQQAPPPSKVPLTPPLPRGPDLRQEPPARPLFCFRLHPLSCPHISKPPHFCLKAFSLCEGLSAAFLSNSSQQGGLAARQSFNGTAEDVKRATVGLSS